MTTDENRLPDHLRIVDLDHLLGLAEIAQRCDVKYSTALSWTRNRTFPAPVKVFKMGPCWLLPEVEEWRKTDNTRRRVR